MEIALIHPYPDPMAYGLRVLRGVLKRAGHRVHLVNLPDTTGDEATVAIDTSARRYPRRALDDLCEVVADCDVVGLSLMTNYLASAAEISAVIRREYPDKLIVWGGVHPTIRPEECLEHADVAVVGEADGTFPTLVERIERAGSFDDADVEDIPGLVYRRDGAVRRHELPRLVVDLDSLPAPDYDTADQWVLWNGRVVPVDDALMMRMLSSATVSAFYGKVGYQTMTSRGCPHQCSYCINSTLRGMYRGQRYVRFRSVDAVIDECAAILRRFPFVDYMWFSDDVFFARPQRDLERFAALYGERVGLPFYLLASPVTLTEDKYRPLIEAGLHTVQMGIETGSPSTQRVFHRERMSNDKVLRAAEIIARHADRTQTPYYDIIIDVPWEDDDNRRETLDLVARLPRPFKLQLFSLVLYPATVAYDRACDEGLVRDEKQQIYDHMYTVRNDHYLNLVLFLAAKGHTPGWLIRALADERIDPLLHNAVSRPIGGATRRVLRTVRQLRDLARAHHRHDALFG